MADLSKRLNAYLSTTVLEMIGLSEDDGQDDREWRERVASETETLGPLEELQGPSDGSVEPEAIRALEVWMRGVAQELSNGEAE